MSLVASGERWNQGALARKRGERPRVSPSRAAAPPLLPQNALGTPSPHSSIVVRSPGSTPHQDGRHQVYPEPQVEPLMRMNKDQDQHPRKTSPQHRSPGLRDKKPPHVDPSDK